MRRILRLFESLHWDRALVFEPQNAQNLVVGCCESSTRRDVNGHVLASLKARNIPRECRRVLLRPSARKANDQFALHSMWLGS